MSSERRSVLAESLAAIERLQSRIDAADAARHEPIAIVGAACRYPGGAETPEQLWTLLRDGVDAVAEVPSDRWDAERFYDPDPKTPGKMITKRGGFLRHVDQFDPTSFGISPREAQTLDPQQRLLLETALESLESAAIAPDSLAGSSTGVFIGITTNDYGTLVRSGGVERADVYSATGNALNAAAGRIAFTFGFHGPTVAVDTACSSSLVAVHLACRALRNGEADLALAGGVNVVLSPDAMIMFSKWGMLAPDGRCKTFDAAADGFVRAEGCGMLALKRLSSARANGDPILAVIRGTAVNQDGRSSGLTVPNGPAQQAVLRRALADARLEPKDLDYVEAHGTGTPLGDPIELEALGAVMAAGHSAERPLLVGSLKTNLGHTEAASGLAGLIKVVMSLKHEAIPPHLHFTRPNPGIDWARLAVRVPTTLTPWPRHTTPRRAGVSSFGFSGTNAHVILEEAPLAAPPVTSDEVVLIPISARDDAALRDVAVHLADFIGRSPDTSLADLASTTSTGRSHFTHRAAVVAASTGDLERDLRAFALGEIVPGVAHSATRVGERPKIAFVFTGQGAQYAGMGRALYDAEPVFKEALDRADATLAPLVGRSLFGVLFPADGASTPLSETAFTQPALFALEYALAELWRSWGIKPSVVLGHSVGEYVAACVAGVMSLEDGLALIAERGRLMQQLPAGGAMAAIFAGEAHVAARIAPYGGRLSIAAINGPEETVVSGDAPAVAEVLASIEAEGGKGRSLDVSHAFHSARLDPMLDALERRAASMRFVAPNVTLISNVTGAPFPAGAAPDAAYWRRHAREPVQFAASLDALRAAGVTAVVEIGPHPTLLALAARAMPNAPWAGVASIRRGRDDRREMLASLGVLYARGASVSWGSVMHRDGRRVALPTYPFQRQRYWVEPTAARAALPLESFDGHPLLGQRHELASAPGTFVWETEVGLDLHPWLRDHRVQGAAIVPATAYIEIAFAAARDVLGAGVVVADEIKNLKPLILAEGERRTLQTTLVIGSKTTATVSVHSRQTRAPFIAHMTAKVTIDPSLIATSNGRELLDAARARCVTHVGGKAFYSALEHKGNQWGPCFQGTQELWIGDGEAIGRVQVPLGVLAEVGRFKFHPAVSDSCGHALVATLPLEAGDGATAGAFVGGGVGQVRFHRSPATTTLWTHARLRPSANGNDRVVIGDVWVYDETGALISETIDARLWYLDEKGASAAITTGAPDDWFYEPRWRRAALTAKGDRAAAPNGTWIVFANGCELAEQLAAQRGANGRTVVVTPGDGFTCTGDRATIRPDHAEDYRNLLAAVTSPAVLMHLWSAGASTTAGAAGVVEGVVHTLHAALALAGRQRPRIWLVTADSQRVVAGDRVVAPAAAALWGLGRTLCAEHAELWGGLVDIATDDASDRVAEQLIREIEFTDAEDKVAYRGGERFVARLERALPVESSELVVSPDATYVISGGLGGIGLAMARRLVERGARHLALIGRSPIPPRAEWANVEPDSAAGRRIAAIGELEAIGACVDTPSFDISDAAALARYVAEHSARGEPAVRGVIHAAGLLPFRALDAEAPKSLRDTLAAKVGGAWALHETWRGQPLDFFVLCSSSSALLRSPLLGAYAAGNAFLDALAQHRRGAGLHALSVNWGTWGEVGMAVEGGRSKGSMLSGMTTIPTASGLAALERLLNAGVAQSAVMPIDWDKLAAAYPLFAGDPFLADLTTGARTPAARAGGRSVGATINNASGDEQLALLAAYLRTEAARTLGMRAEQLDPSTPLSSMGFDSLMAVQLKNQIEIDLEAVVPMIQLLEGPSIEQLSAGIQPLLTGTSNADADAVEDLEGWEAGSV